MTSKSYFYQVGIPSPLWEAFDYLPPEEALSPHPPGIRLKVPFGQREVIGILLKVTSTTPVPRAQLKKVLAVLDEAPLIPSPLLALYQWASEYYCYPLGDAILTTLPSLLKKGKTKKLLEPNAKKQESKRALCLKQNNHKTEDMPLQLNRDQAIATQTIQHSKGFQTFLLWGITGSGKTEVYLNCLSHLAPHQQALILVPEIALIDQMMHRLCLRFPNSQILALHSNLTPKKRAQAWLMAKSGEANIILGTRSAIFTPFQQLGMIIIDEEHDPSFKQSQSKFRYSARDLAIVRGTFENIPVILGSATPSLESIHNIEKKKYIPLSLKQRAPGSVLPDIQLIDIRHQKLNFGISKPLQNKIQHHLNHRGQILLFLNRRGYSPILLCHACGASVKCNYCDAHLTLHLDKKRLYCHHCHAQQPIPVYCLACKQSELTPYGVGTEQLESGLQQLFPDHVITRVDRDSVRLKNSLSRKLDSMHNQETHILIGTQMIAKGHHFENVTCAVMVDTDSSLYSTDFRAIERMGQLIEQVAGRAGRGQSPGEFLIQTHCPAHPFLTILLKKGYADFAATLLEERKATKLPPFAHFALLQAESKKENEAFSFLNQIKKSISAELILNPDPEIELIGPIPAPLIRKANFFRYQLLFHAYNRKALQKLLKKTSHFLYSSKTRYIRWILDIDPQDQI